MAWLQRHPLINPIFVGPDSLEQVGHRPTTTPRSTPLAGRNLHLVISSTNDETQTLFSADKLLNSSANTLPDMLTARSLDVK